MVLSLLLDGICENWLVSEPLPCLSMLYYWNKIGQILQRWLCFDLAGLHLLGVPLMKGTGDFLVLHQVNQFQKTSQFKYNIFVMHLWNFFLSWFWCHFLLGLVFLGCQQWPGIFDKMETASLPLLFDGQLLLFSPRTVPIQERERWALYSSHSTNGDRPSAVLMKVVVHQYITR